MSIELHRGHCTKDHMSAKSSRPTQICINVLSDLSLCLHETVPVPDIFEDNPRIRKLLLQTYFHHFLYNYSTVFVIVKVDNQRFSPSREESRELRESAML